MNLRWLLTMAAPYRGVLLLSTLLMLAESAASLAVPWLGGQFAQLVLTAHHSGGAIIPGLIALLALQAGLKFARVWLIGTAAAQLLADLRVRIYDHLQALPLTFFNERRKGDLLALMSYEVSQLAGFLSGTLLSIAPSLLTVIGAIVLMCRIDVLLAGVAALLVPVFFILFKLVGRRLQHLARDVQRGDAAALSIVDENISMLAAIKSFTREPQESQRYGQQVRLVTARSCELQRIYALIEPAIQLASAAGAVALLWLGSRRIGEGHMSSAELVSFLLYAALLTRPVGGLAAVYGQTKMAAGTLERLRSVLGEAPEALGDALPPLPPVKGRIDFRNVEFSYPGRPAAVSGLTLTVAAGETVAITGPNGAGKSTLAHLLMRLHEPQSGHILIDGHDIQAVALTSLRGQIGIVPQHVLLFNGTVAANIAYGRASADQASIEVAARAAQAHAFIVALPQGYETIVGDHGVRLSGGQRQRLALARALLKDPPILILDEATAMFDPDAEESFIQDARHTLAHRTVIIITHRPAALALADRIVHLSHGHIEQAAPTAPFGRVTAGAQQQA